MTATVELDDAQPRWLEFVCDACLSSKMGSDMKPAPRCPRCKIRMTPEDLTLPRDNYSLLRPQVSRRKAAAA
jgi:hypothetical protein